MRPLVTLWISIGMVSGAAAAVESLRGDAAFPGSVAAIRDIDFQHLVPQFLGTSEASGAPLTRETLGGAYFLTPAGKRGPEYALLVFVRHGDGKTAGYAQVLRVAHHKMSVIQQYRWDEGLHARSRHSYDPGTRTLTLRAAHFLPEDPNCCPSALDVVMLRWNDDEFVEVSNGLQLSESGRRQGKKLGP